MATRVTAQSISSQELGTPPGPPTWMAGTHVPGCHSAALPGTFLAGNWVEVDQPELQPVLPWNPNISGRDLTLCTPVLAHIRRQLSSLAHFLLRLNKHSSGRTHLLVSGYLFSKHTLFLILF